MSDSAHMLGLAFVIAMCAGVWFIIGFGLGWWLG